MTRLNYITKFNPETEEWETDSVELQPVTRATFAKAADVIEENGLAKGSFKTDSCGYCAVGALLSVAGVPEDPEGSFHNLGDAISFIRGEPVVQEFMQQLSGKDAGLADIYDWSDAHQKDEVIKTLREFANEA